MLAKNKASYLRNRDRRREDKFIAAYGMTWAERDALALAQGGRCAICLKPSEALELDHCHETTVVRGLLCGHCNRGIGCLRHDKAILERAIAYLGG